MVINVTRPNLQLKALPPLVGQLKDGLNVSVGGKSAGRAVELGEPTWLQKKGVTNGKKFHIDGFFEVPKNGLYQFHVRSDCDLKITADSVLLFEGKGRYVPQYLLAPLESGLHRIDIAGTGRGKNRMEVSFGSDGCHPISAKQFRSL